MFKYEIDPLQIKSPEQIGSEIAARNPSLTDTVAQRKHMYSDTLGKCEYELMAQLIIERSQRRGEWTSVREEELRKVSSARVRQMVDIGYLVEKAGEFMLTPDAIRVIHTKYPA